ncbi:MAG: helix-turn-helix domain-containing protein [Verrucomicrobiota bacterium]
MSALSAEFVDVMKLMGWNQSETARQLYITSSHVNQIVNGKAEPSVAMVQLLKLTALRRRPELTSRIKVDKDDKRKLSANQEPVFVSEFWGLMRRRKLRKMNKVKQAEYLKSWSIVLGFPFNPEV